MDINQMIEAIKGIDPSGASFWSNISGLFDQMEVAEDEIAKAQNRHPDAKEKLWNAFRLMQPGVLLGFPDELYRAHCRELLERIYQDLDTRPGTQAECLVAFSEMSLVAPLRHDAELAMKHLFVSLFPNQAAQWDVVPTYETYQGATNEILAQVRSKAAVTSRC